MTQASSSSSTASSQHCSDSSHLRIAALGHRDIIGLVHRIALTHAVRKALPDSTQCAKRGSHDELLWVRAGRRSLRSKLERVFRALNVERLTTAFRFSPTGGRDSRDPQPEAITEVVRRGEVLAIESIGVVVNGLLYPAGIVTYAARRSKYFLLAAWWAVSADAEAFQQKILRSHVRGVHVGDLVASTALTTQHRLTRGLRTFINLSSCYTQAAATIDAALRVGRTFETDFTMSVEPTYLPMVLPRALYSRGVPALLETRTDAFVVANPNLEPGDRDSVWVRHQRIVPPGAEVACDRACGHLDLVRSRLMLLRSRDTIQTSRTLTELVGSADSIAVLFLHDFGDGQFFYGFDEFGDLSSWACAVIDIVLEETNCTVLVKSHSIVKPLYRRVNEAALQDLMRRYSYSPRVRFLTVPTSPQLLAEHLEDIEWFGITKHGTISEELPIIGRACISSRLGPWGIGHDFSWRYSDKRELRELVRNSVSLGRPNDWRNELCVYLQRRYGDMKVATLDKGGENVIVRLIDQRLRQSCITTAGERTRVSEYLANATSSDPLLLRAIQEVAASNAKVIKTALRRT